MMSDRLKILISAYACSPYKGSEPGVGWGFVSALARYHDLWVIVEAEKFQADIERYLSEFPDFAKTVHFYFLQKKRNRFLRKLWPPSYYWYYRRWHEDAYSLAKELHREVGFDIVHQLTMVGFREPGYLWKLEIPFVWGPIGGMGLFPWRFLPVLGWYGALYYVGYNLFNFMHMHFMRRPKNAAEAAGTGLLAATPVDQQGAKRYWKCESTLMSEVGVPPAGRNSPTRREQEKPLRLVWTGLHIPRKAMNLALEALALLPEELDWELHVLGDGERTANWKELSRKRGLASRCRFHGWLPRERALEVMASCHVMLITSLRDLTSTITIEALALGLPVVCFDHCGFGGVIDNSCGIKVPVTTPVKSIAGMTAAIQLIARDENLRYTLALGAVRRAQEFSWEEKAATMDRIYRYKLTGREASSR